MQQYKDRIEEELKKKTKQLIVAEDERDHALDELKEMKKMAQDANIRLSESMMPSEINTTKQSMLNLANELKIKEKNVESLKRDLEKAKLFEQKLAEKETMFVELENELKVVKKSEIFSMNSLSESTKKIQELENEVHNGKDSIILITKQLETEIVLIKNELKIAIEAEEMSKKAMDELVLALTEVTKESTLIKEKLVSTQFALEHAKEDTAHLKTLLNEAKIESERAKNTVERLRLEAEDSLLAWNGKEMGFVECMKRFEEERTSTQQENKRLISSLLAAEKMTTKAKEENHKLRDILKQALNESNFAKEAANIARTENSLLKDQLLEKDNALEILIDEIETLKTEKNHSKENVKELNRKLSFASVNDLNSIDEDQEMKLKNHDSLIKDHQDGKKIGKAFSFDLNELRIPIDKHEDVIEEDVNKDEALKGSIFDTETPKSAPFHGRKASSSSFNGNAGKIKSMDFDHFDEHHFDDTEHGSRKKKALLRKFSHLMSRRSFHKRDEVV